MQNIIWGYHVGLVGSKIYCNDFMPKEKDENGKAIKKKRNLDKKWNFKYKKIKN